MYESSAANVVLRFWGYASANDESVVLHFRLFCCLLNITGRGGAAATILAFRGCKNGDGMIAEVDETSTILERTSTV